MNLLGRGSVIQVGQLGAAYLPGKFSEACQGRPVRSIEVVPGGRNRAEKFLKRGGAIVLSGDWEAVRKLAGDLAARERELIPECSDSRQRKLMSRGLRLRIMTTVGCVGRLGELFLPSELAGFLGEDCLPDGVPVLIPVAEAERLLSIPDNKFVVRSLNIELVAHPDVLGPQSQETVDLMCEALKFCEPSSPERPQLLDMGCGSGVLSIAAWHVLGHKSPHVTATDIMPEAVATTNLNWRLLSAVGKAGPISALSTACGSLFEPVGNACFDFIIFNPPWVVAPVRSRADIALMDENQRIVRGFLEGCPYHMTSSGRVVLAYASNAGMEAVSNLESFIASSGLSIVYQVRKRVHTRRAKRQWQNVYAYVLMRGAE
ncbi:MAG: methyltransferase [Armatimonadota bacterium]